MQESESPMDQAKLFELYSELRAYVGWEVGDAERLASLKPILEPTFDVIIDDFYEEIARHPNAFRVITGGESQIARLKQTLRDWLGDLFSGPYDEQFVERRFRVGQRHVEIQLDQFYANVALSRIRGRLLEALAQHAPESTTERDTAIRSINRILDLDSAIIDVAYQREFAAREQRQQRLATLGRVSGGIAHELRNPLNAVKTSVYYLLKAPDASPEKTREHLERIDRQVAISDTVITALSRFARLPVPMLRPVALSDLVEQAIDANPIPDNVKLRIERPEQIRYVSGDHDQLVIVLGNLIRNACEAMTDGGDLTISYQEIAPEAKGNAGRFALSVTDTGCGIELDVLSRIMEPLFSTKTRGLGLGLALAQAILKRHDAGLSVTSQPGEGTTITMTLNIAEESV
jgi:signal transduction histidine kinase